MVTILIVDDSREDALLAQRVLSQCKLLNPAVILPSGDACLDYFEGVAPFPIRKLPWFTAVLSSVITKSRPQPSTV